MMLEKMAEKMLEKMCETQFVLRCLVQLGFVAGISSVLLAENCVTLNNLLKYGKTLGDSKLDKNGNRVNVHNVAAINYFLNIYVPKSWFTHFYVLSALLSLAILIVQRQRSVVTLTGLVLFHSARRWFECWKIQKFSASSKMNVSHYVAGIFFYTSLNIAVYQARNQRVSALWLALFAAAQLNQFCNHRILSTTQKYLHPQGGMFRLVSSAHYFDEITIYSILCAVAANTGKPDLLFLLLHTWVVVNLTVSAKGTYQFYQKQKREAAGATRFLAPYAIFPFVY